MPRFLFTMHSDTEEAEDEHAWIPYLEQLRSTGGFEGGSAIGAGVRLSRAGGRQSSPADVTGYLLVRAASLEAAAALVAGNPTYEAGGTVEVGELLRD